MKKLLLSVICTATLSLNVSASLESANNFKFVGDTQYAGLCQAAATNDIDLLIKNVKQHRSLLSVSKSKMLTLLSSADNFQCAGQSLVDFAHSRGSQQIADYVTGAKTKTKTKTKIKTETTSTSKYKFVGDNHYKNFCKSAVTNNVGLFKRAISSQIGYLGFTNKEVFETVLYADNITCAGESLSEFLRSREATNVMSYIAKKSAK